jgi:hypothetical protein
MNGERSRTVINDKQRMFKKRQRTGNANLKTKYQIYWMSMDFIWKSASTSNIIIGILDKWLWMWMAHPISKLKSVTSELVRIYYGYWIEERVPFIIVNIGMMFITRWAIAKILSLSDTFVEGRRRFWEGVYGIWNIK